MTVADRIAEERKRLGLSQAAFADAVGVSLSSQKRYEKGDREPDTAYLLALERIGVDVDYVLGRVKVTRERLISELREQTMSEYMVGSTGRPLIDFFGHEVPGQEEQYSGKEIGYLLLWILGIEHAEWNAIARRLIKQDKTGAMIIDANDPAWKTEVAQHSTLISSLVNVASELDSELLAAVLEGVDAANDRTAAHLSARKRAGVAVMLYRAFRANGEVDQKVLEEAVTLAAN